MLLEDVWFLECSKCLELAVTIPSFDFSFGIHVHGFLSFPFLCFLSWLVRDSTITLRRILFLRLCEAP